MKLLLCRYFLLDLSNPDTAKVMALCQHLDCEPDEISKESYDYYGLDVFSYGRSEYAIGTDEEADSAWDQSLDSYIAECITPEIEKLEVGNLSDYIKFDEEMWKRDARSDGRGHSLSSYDGNENEITLHVQGEEDSDEREAFFTASGGAHSLTLFIYQIN